MSNAFDQRIAQLRLLRAKMKEKEDALKAELKPFKEAEAKLEALLLTMLKDTGQESAKTAAGTVYRITKTSVSLAEPEVFRRHVIGSENWDLIDWRANKTAVMDYAAINEGELPPGVKVSQMTEIGVRAPTAPRKRKTGPSAPLDTEEGEEALEDSSAEDTDAVPEAAE